MDRLTNPVTAVAVTLLVGFASTSTEGREAPPAWDGNWLQEVCTPENDLRLA